MNECTISDGHKWNVSLYRGMSGDDQLEAFNIYCIRCGQRPTPAELFAMFKENAAFKRDVAVEHEQVCQFIRDMYTGRFAEREKYYWELPQWIRDAIEADPIYGEVNHVEQPGVIERVLGKWLIGSTNSNGSPSWCDFCKSTLSPDGQGHSPLCPIDALASLQTENTELKQEVAKLKVEIEKIELQLETTSALMKDVY